MENIDKPDIILKCKRCEKEWKYTGQSVWYTSCPRCHTAVNVRKKLIELGVIKVD